MLHHKLDVSEVAGSHGSPPPGALAKATPPPEVEVEEEPPLEVMVVPPPPGPELEDEAPPKDCALQSNTPAGPRGIACFENQRVLSREQRATRQRMHAGMMPPDHIRKRCLL